MESHPENAHANLTLLVAITNPFSVNHCLLLLALLSGCCEAL